MSDITVKEPSQGKNPFQVLVKEGDSWLNYSVTLPDELYQKLCGGKVSKSECLKASFRFLLERESKESILRRFELSLISHYFPEFEKEFKNYL